MVSGFTEKYDVVVVGAGHAGVEAAMAILLPVNLLGLTA
jgi:tRNA U34 5-carboxymethylaminomethyl modifying enzyme MnmG/GidA